MFSVIKVFGFTVCKDHLVVDIIYRGDISFNVYDQITISENNLLESILISYQFSMQNGTAVAVNT